jgi:hypothetical protein
MSYYTYQIDGGPVCSITPQGDGMWAIFVDKDHIITTGSPQSCLDMIIEMNADMGKHDQWRNSISSRIENWSTEEYED